MLGKNIPILRLPRPLQPDALQLLEPEDNELDVGLDLGGLLREVVRLAAQLLVFLSTIKELSLQ